jgi:uncharacterized membrane protein YedE/YeeE
VKTKLVGFAAGVGFGFTLAWARLTDPLVIRDMLLLKEPDVFLIMGSAVAVAAVGLRLLKAFHVRALVTGEPVKWVVEMPRRRHIVGSALFALGWSMAGTCPGPVAAMIGQGQFAGGLVAAGLFVGVTLEPLLSKRKVASQEPAIAPAGL